MNFPYTDGFFSIDEYNGFFPLKDPLTKLPERYDDIQYFISNLPELISKGDLLESLILFLENKIYLVKQESDIFVIQVLYRACAFLISAYLLEYSNIKKSEGKYEEGRNILSSQLTQPLEWVAT
jgi:hypothetical protein